MSVEVAEDAVHAKPMAWQDEVYNLLRRHNVTQFAYVPDAGHRILIARSLADPSVHSVPITTEEEGVALLAGADLGGARGVLLMQSSGAGNCVNMLSLIQAGRFPFLVLISMRGDFGEGNPWAIPHGQGVPAGAGGHAKPTEPPAYKRELDPASCRTRFRAANVRVA